MLQVKKKQIYTARNVRNSLCSSTQFRLSTAGSAKVAQLSETGQCYSLWSQELQFTFVNCLLIVHKFKHDHEKRVFTTCSRSCRTTDDVVQWETQTVTNNKYDAKSPPPVILTASRRQSFSCPKSTSSCQSVIFFTSQSHFFT